MPSNVSGAPAQVGFRCSTCGEHTICRVDWCKDHDNLPCQACGGFIDLRSPENRTLIARAKRRRAPLERGS